MSNILGYSLVILLNILAPFVAIGYVIFFWISARRGLLKNLKNELKERFVCYDKSVGDGFYDCIWVHTASAGEILAIKKFLLLINQNFPNRKILVTTTSALGKQVAQDKLSDLENIKTIIAPLDFAPLNYRFTKIFKPSALIVIEKEIWPNMILQAKSSGAKIIFINANMSDRSFKRYNLIRPMFEIILSKIDAITFQNHDIKYRFESLGLKTEHKKVLGNIKYDNLQENPKDLDIVKILGWQDNKILTCGSTHPEEEQIIFDTAKKLDIKIITAPRHLERLPQIQKTLDDMDIDFALLSQIREKIISKQPQVLIADKMGYLPSLYNMADICFVGGTIADKGGHNLLEPAVLGKPLMFGRNTYNINYIAHNLLNNGAKLVDKNNFADTLKNIDTNSGEQIKQTALKYQGVSEKTIEFIKEIIK